MSHTLLSERLQLLGLEGRQAEVYLAALTCGGGSVLELARAGNIERTGIYYHIDQLVALGLLLKGTRGKRQIFLPADPAALEHLLKQKQSALNEALPQLQQLYDKGVERSRVTYYQGEDGLINLYKRLETLMAEMDATETAYIFSRTFDAVEALPEFLPGYFKRRDQMALQSLTLLPYSERPLRRNLPQADALTQAKFSFHSKNRRYIDDQMIPEGVGTVVLVRDWVVMIDFKNFFGSIIENKNLAQTWQMFFKFTWEKVKPLK